MPRQLHFATLITCKTEQPKFVDWAFGYSRKLAEISNFDEKDHNDETIHIDFYNFKDTNFHLSGIYHHCAK